jgi:hypothetical protein
MKQVCPWRKPRRCEICGAPDAHDTRHAAGCPSLPAPSFADLMNLAIIVEEGWEARAPHAIAPRSAPAFPAARRARA